MRKLWLLTLMSCCLISSALLLSAAEPSHAPRAATRLVRVALFKNGLGYFVRRGELSAAQTSILVGPFAAPVHGTFWVSTPSTTGLESLVSREVRLKGAQVDALNVGDLLRANVGRAVTLWTDPEGKVQIHGTIVGFAPDRPPFPEPYRAYRMGATDSGASSILPFGRGEYVLVRTGEGIVTVNAYNVLRADFPGSEAGDIATRFQMDTPGAELVASLRTPRAGDWIGVSYLAKGITWAPSYLVDISDPKNARLTAKALIVNDAEDLTDTHVDLITGFPNLQFANVTSPIAQKTDLATFLQQLTGGGYAGPMGPAGPISNVVSQSVRFHAADQFAPMPEYGVPQVGQQTEDLFFYPVEHVTLPAGDTGYYPLFTITVPYTQIYQWTILDYINQYDQYQRQEPGPDQREIVWHSLRLTNTSTLPWTTAPAETVKDGRILGQDTLSYTPQKAEETLRITQAANVRAEQQERETNRQVDAVQLYGSHFDRITVQGTLRVSNYKGERITMEIKKTVSGKVTETKPSAKIETLAAGLARMNPTQELTWTLHLAAGEKKEATYTYQALIRR